MNATPIRVAVLGPGGVGGLVAALLARQGDSVQVLASDDTAREIARDGLRVESRKYGDFEVRVDSGGRLFGPVDVCFVTVKATHLAQALERVPPAELGAGLIVPFLNGIDHVELLRSAYPPGSVVAATIRVETARVGPGAIRHTSPFAVIEIGPSKEHHDRVVVLADHLAAAGFEVRLRADEIGMLWDKFALLEPLALLTTHEGANVGVIRTRRREDVVALVTEIASVARAEGASVDVEAVVGLFDSVPATMESSMQRDQAAGRPLELDALGGAVVRHAARAGIEVPVTSRIVNELRERNRLAQPGG